MKYFLLMLRSPNYSTLNYYKYRFAIFRNTNQLGVDILNTLNDSDDPLENADTVKFTNNTALTSFSYDGKEYQISLAGFSQDDGVNISNDIIALEDETTTTRLYAKIIEVPAKTRVPEPGMLFGVSLVAAYCIYRRQLI